MDAPPPPTPHADEPPGPDVQEHAPRYDRRRWLHAVGAGGMVALGGGLVLGLSWPLLTRSPAGSAERFTPNEFLRITPDGRITVVCGQSEMGQGVLTAFAMLVADELDADWTQVRAEHAPADPAYANPRQGAQTTGGSSAVRGHWQALRHAGAAAREMLVSAAARRWEVAPAQCRTADSRVHHPDGQRSLGYGELVADASALDIPAQPRVKPPGRQRLVGRSLPRIDLPGKVDGSARYGIDLQLPGRWVAVVERAPWPKAQAERFDRAAALAVRGVREVQVLPTGIAVLADGWWAAQRGRQALRVRWRAHPEAEVGPARSGPSWSTDTFRTLLRDAALTPGLAVEEKGLPAELFERAAPTRRFEADYEVPHLAHACMEPMNATAWVREDLAEVWTGTQRQGAAQARTAALTGLRRSQIRIHTPLLGGGFGRRYAHDALEDAVRLSMKVGRPVQVIYSREDDMRGAHYRPAAAARLRASLTPDGLPDVLQAVVAVASAHAAVEEQRPDPHKPDASALGGLTDLPYAIGHRRIAHAPCDPGPLPWFWRSVSLSQNLFFLESFIDELARQADQDPLLYRHRLLEERPRLRTMLRWAADRAGWGHAPPGRHQGIAAASCFGSHIALVAEISVDELRQLKVHRLVAALDCGWMVHPDSVRAQIEGGLVFGLTAALHGRIDHDQGQVRQGNFDSYRLVRLADMPSLEVHLAESREAPGGVGEPGTPLVAPALANALHAATGRRLRRLPLLDNDGRLPMTA